MSVPFARAKAMMAAISAAMAAGVSLHAVLADIGPYESRGKGKGRSSPSRNKTAHIKRAARKARNRAKHRRAA